MKFRTRKNESNNGINITPLIDVVFILLLFFAVTTSFIVTSSIKVDLPKAKGDAVEQKKNIRIAVDSAGKLYLDGIPINENDLSVKLTELKKTNPEALIVIEADEKALHGKVIFVMDTARNANFVRFAIATEEK